MSGQQPVIVVKKKVAAHGGHHGGAWKVAYADFVTAMMAFFLVLWLVGQGKDVKAADMTVVCVDLPGGSDPGQYLIDHPIGSERWTLAPGQAVTVNGVSAMRYDLSARSARKGELRREVTTFRRGDRVYFFMATFAPSDTPSRDKVRQAVASVRHRR